MRTNRILWPAMLTLSVLLAACGDKDEDDTGGGDTQDQGDDTAGGDDSGGTTEDCQPVEFDDGSDGTYTVSAGDDDVKNHLTMPEGVHRVKGTATWDATEWSMDFAMGTGYCPHSGESLCDTSGDGGELVLDLLASDVDGAETFEAGDQWFAHLSMLSGGTSGDTSAYAFQVEVCTMVR